MGTPEGRYLRRSSPTVRRKMNHEYIDGDVRQRCVRPSREIPQKGQGGVKPLPWNVSTEWVARTIQFATVSLCEFVNQCGTPWSMPQKSAKDDQ